MKMVMPAASAYRDAANFMDVMADHTKHFFPKAGVLKRRTAFLRAENHMQPNLSQRLRHELVPMGMADPLGLEDLFANRFQGRWPWLEERLALWAERQR